jgi:hypothetical protein
MPDRIDDHGFMRTCHCGALRHGKASKTGTSQKTCQTKPSVQSFREEKRWII